MCHDIWIRPYCKDCDIPMTAFHDKHQKPQPCITALENGRDPYDCPLVSAPVCKNERYSRCEKCKEKLREERKWREKNG
jgi:hypothetical protein